MLGDSHTTAASSLNAGVRSSGFKPLLKRNTAEKKRNELSSPSLEDKQRTENDSAQVGQGLFLVSDDPIADTKVRTQSKSSRKAVPSSAVRSGAASSRKAAQASNAGTSGQLSGSKGQPSKPLASDANPTATTHVDALAAKRNQEKSSVTSSLLSVPRSHRGLIVAPHARTATRGRSPLPSDRLVPSRGRTLDSAATGRRQVITTPKQAPLSNNPAGRVSEPLSTRTNAGLTEKRAATASLAGRGNFAVKQPGASAKETIIAGVTASHGAAQREVMSPLDRTTNSPSSSPAGASTTPRSIATDEARQVPSTKPAPRVPTTPSRPRGTRSPRRHNTREPKRA